MSPADWNALLVCPRCRGPLVERAAPPAFDCAACKLRYPVTDGVPVMIVEKAVRL